MNESHSAMPLDHLCPQCSTPLAPGALAGLCPACLLKQGAAGDTLTGGGASFTPPAVAEIAEKFPQLEILELIGKGGMGAVYKARQSQLDRIVALKILPPGVGDDPAFAERFAREARALAKLSHPNIVTIHDFGHTGDDPGKADGGLYYLLMEYVDGITLRRLLETRRVSPREALAIVPEICDALQFAHDHGIVHRDIKPENVLLDRRGRVKVADFGLAKLVGADTDIIRAAVASVEGKSLTEAGKVMGTPQYMAPEQRENPGEVDHRADIYALGVVFYQMLTGELPGRPIEAPSKKVRLDIRLDEIVLRALEKEPGLRYQQASILKTQVETIANAPGKTSPGAAAIPEKERRAESKPVPFTAKLSLGLLLLGLLGTPMLLALAPVYSQDAVAVFAVLSLVLAIIFGLVSRSRLGYGVAVGCVTLFLAFGARVWYLRDVLLPRAIAEMNGRMQQDKEKFAELERQAQLQQAAAQSATPAPFTASGTLPQGALSLAAVAHNPNPPDVGPWRPDGSPGTGSFQYPDNQPPPGDAGQMGRSFVFRATGIPPDASAMEWHLQWQTADGAGGACDGSSASAGAPELPRYYITASVPKSAQTVDIKAGFAMGAWETIAETNPAGNVGTGNFSTRGAWEQNWSYSFITPVENADKSAVFTVTYDVFDSNNNLHVDSPAETRMIAVDDNGEEHTGDYSRSVTGGSLPFRLTATFSGLPLKRIVVVRFEGRPYHWIEFHNVALNPSADAALQAMKSQLDTDQKQLDDWRKTGVPDSDPKVAPIAQDAETLALQIKELKDHPGEPLELVTAKADFWRVHSAIPADPKAGALLAQIRDLEQKRGGMPPISAARYSYTPVFEHTLGEANDGGYNLETGEFIKYTPAANDLGSWNNRDWQKQFSVDLVGGELSNMSPMFLGGTVEEVDESAWDRDPAAFIMDYVFPRMAFAAGTLAWDEDFPKYKTISALLDGAGLLPEQPTNTQYLSEDTNKPVTYLFRTRGGRVGLLQVFAPGSQGVKVRWKLVQDAASPVQPHASATPAPASPARVTVMGNIVTPGLIEIPAGD